MDVRYDECYVNETIQPLWTSNKMDMKHDPWTGRSTINEACTFQLPIESAEAELLHYHRAFGHVSFVELQNVAKLGIMPK